MKIQHFRFFLLFFLFQALFLFFLASCGKDSSQETQPAVNVKDSQKKENLILKVEDSFYFNSDFEKYVRNIVGDSAGTLTALSLSRLYDKFVEEKIILQVVRNQKITLTEEEKKKYLAKLRNEFWVEGEKESLTESDAQALFDKLVIEKYIFELVKDITVEEEEIGEYYELHKREFLQPERVGVSQILLETEEKAVEVLERVKNSSEENFRSIARLESVGPEAAKGGEMGLFKAGQLPFEIEKVIFSLKEGEISPIVESAYGYHIFKLDKRYEPELVSKEEAAASIRVKILDQKIKQFISLHLEELKRTVEWNSYPQNLSFPYQRNVS